MKKITKILSAVLAIMMILAPMSAVFAAGDGVDIGGVQINPDRGNVAGVEKMGNKVIGVLQVIGIIAAVAILIVLGIKYMMGSAEEKAEYKKTMIPYLIGAVLIFAASALASTIFNWAQTITA